VAFRNPFEIALARRAPLLHPGSVVPKPDVVSVRGDDYVVDPDPRTVGLVRAPDFLVDRDPALPAWDGLCAAPFGRNRPPAPDPPLVKLRQALRECHEAGVPDSAVAEVIRLEVAESVMGS
jgi:hypothetical protein